MQSDVIAVGLDTLIGEAAKAKVERFRFVTISCIALDGATVDLLYHFDRELGLKHLRLTCSRDSRVPSLTPVYGAAFLVENEIQDLFGIRFQDLAIDFERTLYLDEEAVVTPFCRYHAAKPARRNAPPQPAPQAHKDIGEVEC